MMDKLIELLENTVKEIEKETDLSNITSGEAFEKYVNEVMKKVSEHDKSLPQRIKNTGKLEFPDIIIDDIWGVEVKFSNSGKWESLGNSIFESTSVEGLQEVMVLFGKKDKQNNRIEVKFDSYENCITDVKVTHSPRFIVSMEEGKESLFRDLGMKYNEFKSLDKSMKGKKIKAYFKENLKPGDDVWWIDQEESSSLPKIRTFNNLDKDEQKQLMAEAFILFPEVLSDDRLSKYNRVAPYWLTQYQVYNPALRDKFSASGKVKITVSETKITVSKVFHVLYSHAPEIEAYLHNPSNDFLEIIREKWEEIGVDISESVDLTDQWLELIDKHGKKPAPDFLPSSIYRAGISVRS